MQAPADGQAGRSGCPSEATETTRGARAGEGTRSGGGAFADRSPAQTRILEGRGHVGLVERADVCAGRDDLVDPVEDLVGECDVETGQEIVELLHRVWPEERA